MACDPDAMTRVYHHVREVEADIPRGIGVTQRSFEEWRLQSIDVFDLIREADLLVVRDEEHDGVSFLRRPAGCHASSTKGQPVSPGTSADKGLPSAAKVRPPPSPRANGARELRTWNSDRGRRHPAHQLPDGVRPIGGRA
jgi:hypothetical protein